jgi:2-polyprenylphenol 6-hydroxylase
MPKEPCASKQDACVDVLVVGAGPVGMAMARALHGEGFRVALVESRPVQPLPNLQKDTKWYSLAQDVWGWLQTLGVQGPGQPIDRVVTSYQGGGVNSGVDGGLDDESVQGSHWAGPSQNFSRKNGLGPMILKASDGGYAHLAFTISSHVLVQQLTDLVKDLVWYRPDRLTDLSVASDGVHARLASGSCVRAQLVVGADGHESWVRGALGIKSTRWTFPQQAVVFRGTFAEGQNLDQTGYEHFFPGGALAVLPLGPGLFGGVWMGRWPKNIPSPEPRQALVSQDQLMRWVTLVTQTQPTSLDIGLVTPITMQRSSSVCSAGAVVVGDAAHSVHPIAGQGLNLGLRHGWDLVEVLRSRRALGLEPALDLGSWAQRYQRQSRRLQLATSGLVYGYSLWQVPGLWSLSARVVNGFSWVRRAMMRFASGPHCPPYSPDPWPPGKTHACPTNSPDTSSPTTCSQDPCHSDPYPSSANSPTTSSPTTCSQDSCHPDPYPSSANSPDTSSPDTCSQDACHPDPYPSSANSTDPDISRPCHPDPCRPDLSRPDLSRPNTGPSGANPPCEESARTSCQGSAFAANHSAHVS